MNDQDRRDDEIERAKAELTACFDRAREAGYRLGSSTMRDLAEAEHRYQQLRARRSADQGEAGTSPGLPR